MWRPEPVAGWPCATVRWSTRTRSSAPPPDLADFRRARPRGAAWRTGAPDASRLGAAPRATATFARMADLGYDGRVAIITGAGGGLGREHALLLASRGAQVVVNDLGGSVGGEGGSAGPAETTAKDIENLGGVAVADTNSVATPEGGAAIV